MAQSREDVAQCRDHVAKCREYSSHLEAEFRLTDELVLGSDDLRLTVVDGADICINDLNIHAGDDVVAHAGA